MSQMSPEPHMQQVDLTTLTMPQLTQLKQQLDQELALFQESLHSLKVAQGKFQNSGECLEKVTPAAEGKSILVPLTGSMYVPGRLANTKNVLIDIGTGYYAEQDIESARDYFKRKIAFVTEQMEKIQIIGLEKSKVRDTVAEVMELKMQPQSAHS
ncbi:hypothetical protein ILUMI_25720 [Ignelater luminosus]|uniref:Prefoldin subunit 5 n=1 Tax=Ignelater luminosus TaxID=2038154 RepID=A0A8K0C7W0_IGNLU|nr:hypothetical protein ILUMI_25720 [Ignelater luminosus]